jgi:glutathione peroxidase
MYNNLGRIGCAIGVFILSVAGSARANAQAESVEKSAQCPAFLNQTLRKLHSKERVNLCSFYKPGKPLVIVNTASHCGYTGQFKGLEALYQAYKDQHLVLLGFPSNTFKQEEDTEMGVANVCYKNYGVTFPMFEPVAVRGQAAHPLFTYLAEKTQAPSWNFNKYLIAGPQGEVTHFGSNASPLGDDLEAAIKKALQ